MRGLFAALQRRGARTRRGIWPPAGLALAGALASSTAGAVGQGNDLLPDVPAGSSIVRLTEIASVGGSSVSDISNAGDGSGRLFIVSPNGVIRVRANGVMLQTPFLNAPAYPPLRAMSGLAFHPDYASNGKLYVITGEQTPNAFPKDFVPPQVDTTAFDNVLVEYHVSASDPNRADPASRREIMRVHQPHDQHDVDEIAFAPSGAGGYLLIAVGDGGDTRLGSPSHYETNAQLTTNPYGKFLRIDVDHIGPNGRYAIPPDNPFAGGALGNVPEIFAWGVRNPYRISVDRLTGLPYSGVNGDFTIEWVVRVENGRNYGWASREGGFLWNPVTGNASLDPNPNPAFTLPLGRYDHNWTTKAYGSVISGYVYRGARMPDLYGKLMLLDYVAGEMMALDVETGTLERVGIDPLGDPLLESSEITWGEDEVGELYLGSFNGSVKKVAPRVLCGDLGGDADLHEDDANRIRAFLIGGSLSSPEQARCPVIGPPGACDLLDSVLIRRAAAGLQPGVAPVCAAAAG